ncbi:hypothetical protein [Pseudonocardia spinosispora]|uniref:hypothetical protein n=1 Tax=Pseudonocardia spinosispora TaxID=103441 RepID=UPI0004005A07|nr:hypothetical protein [Pseudonocardia spinosispora]
MKLALMIGGMAAGRRAGGPGELLGQGTKLLRQSPELSALTDQVRGRLLDAGKGAVLAVAARQVESLTDRVGKRVESLGNVGSGPGAKEPNADEPDDAVDEVPDDEAVEADDEQEPPPRRATRRRATSTSAGAGTKSSRSDGSSSPAPRRRSAASTSGKSTRTTTRKSTSASGSTAKTRRPARARRSGSDD